MGVKKLKQDVKFIAGNKEKGESSRHICRTVAGEFYLLDDKEYLSYTFAFYLQIFAALQILLWPEKPVTPSVLGCNH